MLFALWPAGFAIASVVGTDLPAAALLALALALLVTLGAAPATAAALAFGAAMGLCAWVRAVALPLSALAIGYWLARRQRLLRAVLLTGAGVAADAGRAAAVGHPARAPERRALFHRRSRRHHRADRRQSELGGNLHARAQPHVQGRHRPQRPR